MRVSDQWSGFPAFREGPPRPKVVKNTRFSFEIASEIIQTPCVLQSSVNAYSCTAAADLRVTSVVPQPQHIASFNQATYSITRETQRETAKRPCIRMKRLREAVQRNFTRVPQQEGEAACTSHHSLETQVFAVREATRYSGLRSLHVVHGD